MVFEPWRTVSGLREQHKVLHECGDNRNDQRATGVQSFGGRARSGYGVSDDNVNTLIQVK